MKFCDEGCIDACDWCKHFSWNDWICNLNGSETNPGSSCEDFYCSRIIDENNSWQLNLILL